MPIRIVLADADAAGGAPAASDAAAEQAARHQAAFREVNENIAKMTGLLTETSYNRFICECSNMSCAESLEITTAEYEEVRSAGTRFVVLPGHQQAGVEQVVHGNGRFLVVERLGRAAGVADADNPRRR